MINYNEDYEYAHQRISQTIVRMADTGIPVWVNEVFMREKRINVSPLTNMRDDKFVKLKDLDVSSPPLGYVNFSGSAFFVMRVPRRRDWRQGIRSANCVVDRGASAGGIHFEELMGNPALHNCIIGKYPSVDRILFNFRKNEAKEKKLSLAWDRHWAVNAAREVFYKDWGVVGDLSRKGNDLTFKEGFAFLRESFEESVL